MAWEQLMQIAGVNVSYLSGITTPPSNNVQADVLVLGDDTSAWNSNEGYTTKRWDASPLFIQVYTSASQRQITVGNVVTGTIYMTSSGGSASACRRGDAVFYIDHENQIACAVGAWATQYGNTWIEYRGPDSAELYNVIMGLVPPAYTWQSVVGVYGKSGHVVFSHVLDDSILTGSDINDLNADAFAFYGATRIDRLIANAPTGTEVTAFYSGDFNHLTVTKGELSMYVTVKMYVRPISSNV